MPKASSTYKGHDWITKKRGIELFGKACQKCGSKRYVYTSFIDGDPKNHKDENLRRVCASCRRREWWAPRKETIHRRRELFLKTEAFEKNRPIPVGWGFYRDVKSILGISRERTRQLKNQGRVQFQKLYNNKFIYNLNALNYERRKVGRPRCH